MDYEIRELKKENIDFKHWEFEFQQRAEQPILLCDFFCRSLSTYLLQWMTSSTEKSDYLFTDSSKGYNNPLQGRLLIQKLKEKLNDPVALQHFLKSSSEFPRDFNKGANEVNEAIKDQSILNEELAKYWQKMDTSFIALIPWFFYPYYVSRENILTDRVKDGLEKYQKEIEEIVPFDEALLTVIFPIKKTAFQLEQEDMLKLISLAERNGTFADDPLFKEKAEQYLEKYGWLTTFILAPLLPMSYTQLVERVKKTLKEDFKENLKIQSEMTVKNSRMAEKIIVLSKNDPQLLTDIENARELAYALTAGIEEAYRSSSRYLGFMQLVAKRIDVEFQDMKFLFSREIYDTLLGREVGLSKKIEERKKGFVILVLNGRQYANFGEEGHTISEWIDRELNTVDTTVSFLKGQTACKGFATGRVKIVLEPSTAHMLKEGEILICPMTNPDYVPAMKRSGAIVTDEGGLLSHASIMSREFGKPCIIGTKIATQVLHDGDLVEVDADKGVVRILKRK